MATTSIPSNCAAVTNALLAESGRFGPGIFARAARKRPIIGLMAQNRGAWLNGMGLSLAAVTFERSLPDTYAGVWANIAVSDGDSVNACLPPTDTAAFGQTTRTYQPQHMAINSDHFCIRDIQFDWQYAEMLQKITMAFADISEWTWASRYTSEYVRLAGHHFVLRNSGAIDTGTGGYSTLAGPNAILTQGFLDDIYMDLYREGADLASGIAEDTGEPVFTIITSSEVLKKLLLDNPDLRDDKRYAFMGKGMGEDNPLATGMPTKRRIYGNFIFEIDPYPRKFTFSGGVYTEIPPFVKSATTKGSKQNLNPAYKAAPIVETIVWHRDNYQSLAVNTITNPAPGWNFDPHSWMGEFSPRNILHENCNPDGTIIFWRALFADASKPINPYVGISLLSLSCPIVADLKDCNGYTT